MPLTKPPCYNCPQRQVGCRTNCNHWKEWEAIHADEKARMRKSDGEEAAATFLAEQKTRARLARVRERTKERNQGAVGRMLHK